MATTFAEWKTGKEISPEKKSFKKRRISNEWDPFTSKWKASLEVGMKTNLEGEENILYLGASSGTTISHLHKLTKGIIFAVEKSPQMAIPLIRLAEKSENIAPIFADAHNTDYLKKHLFKTKIQILFQDIPSHDQIEILTNASKLVDKSCKIFLSLKTQSISQDAPQKTLEEVKKKLEKDFKIIDCKSIEPYHKKHYFLILEKKKI